MQKEILTSKKLSNRPYAFLFRFRIGLHSDDTEVLVKIQNKLGIGSITSVAFFEMKFCLLPVARSAKARADSQFT